MRRAFTLMEAALTTIIVGVGTVSVLQLLACGTINNIEAQELTTGTDIAQNVREISIQKSFAQVLTMNNTSHQPPWDSRSQAITDLPDWEQTITVEPVDPDNLSHVVVDSTPDAVRVTVVVTHNSRRVCAANWYSFKPAS